MDNQEGDHALVSGLFMELGSEIRYDMLASLDKGPAKLSSLARQLDITAQHAHQNINRLIGAGLAERGDGTFHITELGRIVTKQIPSFLFIKKHQAFFSNHTLAGIPEKFVQRIGALRSCRMVDSITAVLQKLKDLESSATKSLRLMVPQTWPEEGEIMIDRASREVQIHVLLGYNTISPKNVMEMIPRIREFESKGIIKGRMVQQLNVGLYIADNSQAAVMFQNAKGEVDMNNLFAGEDPMFCEWCSDYFDSVWESSMPVNPSKIKVVEY